MCRIFLCLGLFSMRLFTPAPTQSHPPNHGTFQREQLQSQEVEDSHLLIGVGFCCQRNLLFRGGKLRIIDTNSLKSASISTTTKPVGGRHSSVPLMTGLSVVFCCMYQLLISAWTPGSGFSPLVQEISRRSRRSNLK